jgi:hypothetical protein
VITQEQLEAALAEQRVKGGYLSQHLIALRFATEEDIAVCLSNQYNFAYLPLKNYSIPDEVLRIIPLKWIKIYSFIPIDKVGRCLSVAMADPLNEGVINMLEEMTHLTIQVFISTYSEINSTIDRYFQDEINYLQEVAPFDINKLMVLQDYIQTNSYNGIERRRFIRIDKALSLEYNFHSQMFSAQTINISFGGLCFMADLAIPIDTDLICKVCLKEGQMLDCLLKVLRVQSRQAQEPEGHTYFEIAGVFSFIGDDDKLMLAEFLKELIDLQRSQEKAAP